MKRHVLVGAETLDQARDYVGRGSFMDMAAESLVTITKSSTAAAIARAFAGIRSLFRPELLPWRTSMTP